MKNAERIGKDYTSYNIHSDMPFVTYGPVGCDQCGKTGFKGRVGLYEAILTDDTIARVMAQVPTPTERDIKKASEHQKIFTMIEDGVIKILSGITSFDEIQGVVDLSEDVGDDVSQQTPQSGSMPSPASPSWQEEQIRTREISTKGSPSYQEGVAEGRGSFASGMMQQYTPSQETDELTVLIDYLKALERDLENQQKLNHSVHVEKELMNIRNNIEIMMREVAQ